MQTTMTWKVRVLSLVLICLALLALSLLTDISTIGATGRFAWNAVMAALLMSARSFDTVLAPRLCACSVRGAGGSYPEINFLHLRILLEVGCLSLEHRASGLQDVGVVGNIQR